MGLLDKVEHALDLKIAKLGADLTGRAPSTAAYRGPARTLAPTDLDAFLDAAESRDEPVRVVPHRMPRHARPQTAQRFLSEVHTLNPLRLRRLRRDLRWLRKLAEKAGIDPHEIGYYL